MREFLDLLANLHTEVREIRRALDRPPTGPEPLLITPAEAARRLGIDQTQADPARCVRDMARQGHLAAVKVGNRTTIRASSVVEFVEGER